MIISIELKEIPRMSFRILIVMIISVLVPFTFIHGHVFTEEIQHLSNLIDTSIPSYMFRMLWIPFVFICAVVLGIVLHEVIHAVTFANFLPSKLKGVEFGFDDINGIPYVHIKEPISISGFRIGTLMPLLILGFLPIITGLVLGLFWLTFFGVLFTISSSGDILLVAKTLGISSGKKLLDLPDRVGFEVLPQER